MGLGIATSNPTPPAGVIAHDFAGVSPPRLTPITGDAAGLVTYQRGNRAVKPGSYVEAFGGLTIVEEQELKSLERKWAALQELRQVLGLKAHILHPLHINPSVFREAFELHTEEELNDYMEHLAAAACATGSVYISTPDVTPLNTPPSTPPNKSPTSIPPNMPPSVCQKTTGRKRLFLL